MVAFSARAVVLTVAVTEVFLSLSLRPFVVGSSRAESPVRGLTVALPEVLEVPPVVVRPPSALPPGFGPWAGAPVSHGWGWRSVRISNALILLL